MEWIETEATLQSTAQKGGRERKREEKKGERKTGCDELNRSRTVWVAAHWSYGHTFQCSSSSNATWWERFNTDPKHLERDFKRLFCPRQKNNSFASLLKSNCSPDKKWGIGEFGKSLDYMVWQCFFFKRSALIFLNLQQYGPTWRGRWFVTHNHLERSP